jgi:hypothetical protein
MLPQYFIGYLNSQMFKMSTIPNALLIMCKSGILLTGLRVELEQKQFQLRALGLAVFLVILYTQCSLNNPTGKSLVVLSQEIGVDTPHSSLHCPPSHSPNVMNGGFTDAILMRVLPYRLLGDCMKTSNTVSTYHCQLNCELFRAFLAHILHCSLSTQRITQQCSWYTCWWWCSKFISLSLHLIHTHSFSSSI